MSLKIVQIKCKDCSKVHNYEVEISFKELNKYGFEKNSKGDFITSLIFEKQILNVNSIFTKLSEKYPQSSNLGRLNSVLNKLRKNKLIFTESQKITINKK